MCGDFFMSCEWVFNNSWSQKKSRNGSIQFYPSTGTGGQDVLNPHHPLSGVYKCPEPPKIGSFSLNRSLGLRKYQGMGGHCPCWTMKATQRQLLGGCPPLGTRSAAKGADWHRQRTLAEFWSLAEHVAHVARHWQCSLGPRWCDSYLQVAPPVLEAPLASILVLPRTPTATPIPPLGVGWSRSSSVLFSSYFFQLSVPENFKHKEEEQNHDICMYDILIKLLLTFCHIYFK